jgi:ATP-dependent exoDNAse (exonuclease V) beta subunit
MATTAGLGRADAANRLRALTDLDATLLVEAGAGSGKTAVLAGRIAMLLAAGRAPEGIAAISFTEASASELRERVERFVGALHRGEVPRELAAALPAGPGPAQRVALAHAVTRLDALACTTIHGFCRILLTPWPVEAGIDPGAAVADAAAADLLFDDVLQEALRERLSVEADGEDALAALFLLGEDRPEGLVADLAQTLRRYRGATVPEAPDLEAAWAALQKGVAAFHRFLGKVSTPEPDTAAMAEGLKAMLADVPDAADGKMARLHALLRLPVPEACSTSNGAFKAYRKKTAWAATLRGRASAAEAGRINDGATALYVGCTEAYADLKGAAAGVLFARLAPELRAIVDRFQQAKHDAGLLDFDDLLHGARDLLAANATVRAALAGRFRHVLVDEFQDTDPVQAEILWRLCGDPPRGRANAPWPEWRLRNGALFLVGDPKQAIYRFRGADVQTYVRARDALAAGAPGNVLAIGRNFRSVAPILDWVNDRFADPLGAPGQPGFAPLFSATKPLGGRPNVCALDLTVAGTTAAALRDAEAEQVADTCVRLIGALPVRGSDGSARLCRAGDIALLAPTGTELWRYERALEDRGLPVATQAGKGFFRRQEVKDLIALAGVLADPRDTLALGALLRGPMVGLTEEALLDTLDALPPTPDGGLPRLHLWLPAADIADPLLRETLEILQGLSRRARATTPYVLLAQAVEELRVRPLLRQRGGRSAERALANVDAFLEATRAWETRGLAAFALTMRQQWQEETRTQEARPDAEQEAVSLITMHAAKGLEWAVVIPVNTAGGVRAARPPVLDRVANVLHANLLGASPPGCAAALAAEGAQLALERQRLWYVAATRARDLLLLPRPDVPVPANAWCTAVPLALDALPAFDPSGLPASALPALDEPPNRQDRPAFAAEAEIIAARATRLVRVAPSRAEAGAEDAEPTVLTEPGTLDAPDLPRGGRGRGLVLHKLMEEVLTGETAAAEAPLRARAATLMATCPEPATDCDPAELAATVLRTLALPEVAAVRDRLVPEFGVAASISGDGGEQVVLGIADAVALGADGTPELVIDWKSDVAPDAATAAGYAAQVRTYLAATGAASGLIVFMTPGTLLRVATARS